MRFQLLHTYYGEDALTPDFIIKPTLATATLLKGYGLTYRFDAYGFRILYAADDDRKPIQPLSDLEDGTSLDFILQLQSPEFMHFTDLDPDILRNKILIYDSLNQSSSANTSFYGNLRYALDAPVCYDVKPSTFTYEFTLGGNPYTGTLRVRNADLVTVWEKNVVRNQDDRYITTVSLGSDASGVFLLDTLDNGVPSGPPIEFYVDDTIPFNSTFGILRLRKETLWEDLQTDNESDPAQEIGMAIQFNNREEVWQYKIVFKFTPFTTESDFKIVDGLSTVLEDNRYNLIGSPIEFFFEADDPASKFNGYDALVFKSKVDGSVSAPEQPFPLFKESKYDLNLQKYDGVSSFINMVTNLPNPGTKTYVPEVIIYV